MQHSPMISSFIANLTWYEIVYAHFATMVVFIQICEFTRIWHETVVSHESADTKSL